MLPLVAMFGNNRKICAYFPGWSDGKASTNRETWVHPCVGKIPWRRKRQPTPVLLPRKSHGWRSLVQATVHGVAKSRARLSDFTRGLPLPRPAGMQGKDTCPQQMSWKRIQNRADCQKAKLGSSVLLILFVCLFWKDFNIMKSCRNENQNYNHISAHTSKNGLCQKDYKQ